MALKNSQKRTFSRNFSVTYSLRGYCLGGILIQIGEIDKENQVRCHRITAVITQLVYLSKKSCNAWSILI
jgi:hypothetical protein